MMIDARQDVMTELRDLFDGRGSALYFGENVTEREHALQAACLAVDEHASDELVVSALLHDVGHLLHGQGEHVADAGIDARHEDVGCAWLRERFPAEISEPARLHVAAKRYLCATNAGYLATLSEASKKSLALQGGPMTPAEVLEFEAQPHWRSALRVRTWDDKAKIVGWTVPGLEAYAERIRRLAT